MPKTRPLPGSVKGTLAGYMRNRFPYCGERESVMIMIPGDLAEEIRVPLRT